MSTPPPRWWMRFQWRAHRLIWDLSGGRLGRRAIGMPVLELVTTGHKSGRERSILITYVDTQNGPALAGSNAGASSDPAWVKNLRNDPDARIRRNGQWQQVRARFPEAEERADIWAKFIEADDGYAEYEEMVSREIPIVVLEAAAEVTP